MKHINDRQHIDDLVTHHLADDSGARAGFNGHRVTSAITATALDAAAMQHGNTQYHTLLQYQRQDEQQHGAGNTHRRVSYRHLTVIDNRAAHADHGFNYGSHSLIAHRLRHVAERGKHRLVAHHHAHVTIERHMALFTTFDALGEVAREIDDTITLLAVHGILGLLHVGSIAYNINFLSGIKATGKVAAQCSAVIIDNNDPLVTYYLGIIDERIQHGVNRIKQQEEDDHALVAEDEQQLASANLEHLDAPEEESAMFQFLSHIIKARKRDSDTPSSTAMTTTWAGW